MSRINIISSGDIFESKCETLVCPVNCQGVMGKGLALAFKNKYPQMFFKYKELCNKHLLLPGNLWLWKGTDKNVLCFPTKMQWRLPSNEEWILQGIQKFRLYYQEKGIDSVAFPLLGAGLGGLDKEKVLNLMVENLKGLNGIYIEIYK